MSKKERAPVRMCVGLPGEEEERRIDSVHPRAGPRAGGLCLFKRKTVSPWKRLLSLSHVEMLYDSTEEESDRPNLGKPWITDLRGNRVGTKPRQRGVRAVQRRKGNVED